MTRRFPRLLAVLLAAVTPAIAAAQTGKDMGPAGQYYQPPKTKFKFQPGLKKSGGEVVWTAKEGAHITEEKNEYVAVEGGMTIKYQDITVVADKMTFNQRTKDVVAEGHVILDQGPIRLTADQLFYNLDTKLGTLFHATGAMEPSLYFTADKAEKIADTRYLLTESVFTSCDINRPSWSFHVARADVTLDDYAHMRDVQFRASRLPVFWAPSLVWPTKRDRSRGFLIPRLLISQEFGERLETGYFLPWGDSADATIYTDLNTKGYNGVGVDARYLPSPDIKLGEISAYTVHDVEQGKLQWKYQVQHAQDNLPGGFRGVVDVEDFSNIDFFRRFDRDPRIHTLSQIYSQAYLTKNLPTYSFNVLTDRRDIFGAVNAADPFAPPPRQRFEQLPSLQFRLYPNRIGNTPLYLSLESSASHLITHGLLSGPEANYYRADVFPTLSLQLRTPAWLSIRPQISVRDTWYSSSLDPTALQTGQQVAVDDKLTRTYAQGEVDVVGPSFSKIFNKSLGGFTRFKHVIEPRVRYIYTSNVADQERVIRFDTVDSPFLPIVRDSVEYSLTQRLIGREAGAGASSREVLSFSLRQSVSLSKPFTTATGGSLPGTTLPPGQDSKFTPLVASLHVNPYQSITLDANATFGNVSHQIEQTSISANLMGTGDRADKYLSFTWFATYTTPQSTFDTSASQVRINAGSSLLKDRVRADVQLNFDAKLGTFLEQRYLIGTNASCYGVAFELRRYLVYLPEPTPKLSYGIAVTLKNVGTIGTH
ncbi:MAG TPA: LPS assembly protein LptD [Thermoanaerobaculia bacterium]